MNLKTSAGVGVSIDDEETDKLVIFDKPVRALVFTRKEAVRIGSMLIRGSRSGITADIRELINSGFFKKPRAFGDVRTELESDGNEIEPSSLNVILSKMAERGELEKSGQKRSYRYTSSSS